MLRSAVPLGIDEDRRVFRRRWRQFDIDAFTGDLQQSVSSILRSPPADADDWFTVYDRSMLSLLDKHAPLKLARSTRRRAAPWYDAECQAAKAIRRKAEKLYRLHRSTDRLTEWRRQSLVVRSLFQSKYTAYWAGTFIACKGDTREMWSNVNRLLRHTTTPSSMLTVDDFSNHFRNKVACIR